MVEAKLIKYRRNIFFYIVLVSGVLSVLFSFVCLVLNEKGIIFSLSLYGIFLFIFIGPLFIKQTKLIGSVVFNINKIIIKKKKKYFEYNFEEINDINIYYSGYRYQDDSNGYNRFALKSGADNLVELKIGGRHEELLILIENEKFLGLLIKQWKNIKSPRIRIYREFNEKKIIWTNYK